jgi:hypothetical protein
MVSARSIPSSPLGVSVWSTREMGASVAVGVEDMVGLVGSVGVVEDSTDIGEADLEMGWRYYESIGQV